jgi:hypothetical protein
MSEKAPSALALRSFSRFIARVTKAETDVTPHVLPLFSEPQAETKFSDESEALIAKKPLALPPHELSERKKESAALLPEVQPERPQPVSTPITLPPARLMPDQPSSEQQTHQVVHEATIEKTLFQPLLPPSDAPTLSPAATINAAPVQAAPLLKPLLQPLLSASQNNLTPLEAIKSAPAPLNDVAPPAEPSLSISIGHIDIHSPKPPAPKPAASAPARFKPKLELSDYLALRKKGER